MDKQTYYQILGVEKNATTEEIKTAYKKLALVNTSNIKYRNGIQIRILKILKKPKSNFNKYYKHIQV